LFSWDTAIDGIREVSEYTSSVNAAADESKNKIDNSVSILFFI
jgi:hypothetical protein